MTLILRAVNCRNLRFGCVEDDRNLQESQELSIIAAIAGSQSPPKLLQVY